MKRRNRNYSLSFKHKAVELSPARGNVKQSFAKAISVNLMMKILFLN